jgi:hypothetical protein
MTRPTVLASRFGRNAVFGQAGNVFIALDCK